MFDFYRLGALLVLSCMLSACGALIGVSTNQRTEHHYAFGKPAVLANTTVAPVVAQPTPRSSPKPDLAAIVYFDFDSYSVRSNDQAVIAGHAQWMRIHPTQSLLLRGHTDVRGGAEYNLSLGQKRAEAVRKNLQHLGVEPQRIEAVSYGKEQLADLEQKEAAHQRNRRVEFNYR